MCWLGEQCVEDAMEDSELTFKLVKLVELLNS